MAWTKFCRVYPVKNGVYWNSYTPKLGDIKLFLDLMVNEPWTMDRRALPDRKYVDSIRNGP